MRHLLVALALCSLPAASVAAQSVTHDSVYAVVTQLFDRMRARDTTAMRAAFAPGAILQSISAQGLRGDPLEGWLNSVASAPAEVVLDERLGERVVQVRGGLATVWVDYWFFVGDRFSHCGVDAITLARMRDGWRITAIADTREREGCSRPPTHAPLSMQSAQRP